MRAILFATALASLRGTADSRGRPDEPAAADVAATVEPDACHGTVPLERRLHLLFVTDCTAYEYTQGNVLLASAVGRQPARFTWLVSNCPDEAARRLFDRQVNPCASVFHTTSGSMKDRFGKTWKPFQASNRPLALEQWLASVPPAEPVIGLLDPDEFFVGPIRFDGSTSYHRLNSLVQIDAKSTVVMPKIGVAAKYGYSGCRFNRGGPDGLDQICAGEGHCDEMLKKGCSVMDESYGTGPPWFMTASDWKNVSTAWPDLMLRTKRHRQDYMSEQYSFSVTQAYEGITNRAFALMFSNPSDGPWTYDSGWSDGGNIEVCKNGLQGLKAKMPPLVHACHTYAYGTKHKKDSWHFHKDHVPKDILECDMPLLTIPDVSVVDEHGNKNYNHFFACTFLHMVNDAARAFKKKNCDMKTANFNETYQIPGGSNGFVGSAPGLGIRSLHRGGWGDPHPEYVVADQVPTL